MVGTRQYTPSGQPKPVVGYSYAAQSLYDPYSNSYDSYGLLGSREHIDLLLKHAQAFNDLFPRRIHPKDHGPHFGIVLPKSGHAVFSRNQMEGPRPGCLIAGPSRSKEQSLVCDNTGQ